MPRKVLHKITRLKEYLNINNPKIIWVIELIHIMLDFVFDLFNVRPRCLICSANHFSTSFFPQMNGYIPARCSLFCGWTLSRVMPCTLLNCLVKEKSSCYTLVLFFNYSRFLRTREDCLTSPFFVTLSQLGALPFDATGLLFGSQAAREYVQCSQPEWLHMQVGGSFERAT